MKNLLLITVLSLCTASSFAQQPNSEKVKSNIDMVKVLTEKQVIHHVFFYLKNPHSKEDILKLKEGLKTLEAIGEVEKLIIGEPASTLKRDVVVTDWQVSEIMYFKNIAAQDAYQLHPTHKLFVDNYSNLWEKVLVYDMLVD